MKIPTWLVISILFSIGSSLSFGNAFTGDPDSVYIISKENLTDSSQARPVIGWDRFIHNIIYPIEAKQSFQGDCFHVGVTFDSIGITDSISYDRSVVPPLLAKSICTVIDSTLWLPSQNGRRAVDFYILFVPRANNQSKALVIETQGRSVVINSYLNSMGKWHNSKNEIEAPDSAYLIPRGFTEVHGDSLIDPRPKIGWDSLVHRITFPKIAKRAGFDGPFLAVVQFDSLGAIRNFTLMPEYHIYVDHVRNAFDSIEWYPATINGRPTDGMITIPIIFSIKSFPMLIILESRCRKSAARMDNGF